MLNPLGNSANMDPTLPEKDTTIQPIEPEDYVLFRLSGVKAIGTSIKVDIEVEAGMLTGRRKQLESILMKFIAYIQSIWLQYW